MIKRATILLIIGGATLAQAQVGSELSVPGTHLTPDQTALLGDLGILEELQRLTEADQMQLGSSAQRLDADALGESLRDYVGEEPTTAGARMRCSEEGCAAALVFPEANGEDLQEHMSALMMWAMEETTCPFSFTPIDGAEATTVVVIVDCRPGDTRP